MRKPPRQEKLKELKVARHGVRRNAKDAKPVLFGRKPKDVKPAVL